MRSWFSISSRSTSRPGFGGIPWRTRKRDWFKSVVDLYRPRAKVLQDFPKQSRFFFIEDVESDPAAVEKFLKDEKVLGYLRTLADRLEALPEFTHRESGDGSTAVWPRSWV